MELSALESMAYKILPMMKAKKSHNRPKALKPLTAK
jgi:hypothetical protein